MSTYGKRKGAGFETGAMKWLREKGLFAERLTKAGAKDEGDIVVVSNNQTYILELKATKALSLPEFWREAVIEAQHYADARKLKIVPKPYVIIKRRMAGIEKAWVVEDFEQWVERVKKCNCY
jgi:Holliday junction resolvase